VRRLCALAAGLMVCLWAHPAQASCVGAVVVDGAVLNAVYASDWALPASAGRVRAVAPACNDAGRRHRDGTTTVVRLEGVPTDVAVRSIDGAEVYLAGGSLTALAAHPLHQASRRFARRSCGRRAKLEGTAEFAGFDSVTLLSSGRRHFVRVDARSALVNRPAYQPVHRGQRLRIDGRRCGTRLVADRIAFTGPTVVPDRYESPDLGSRSHPLPWRFALVISAVSLFLGWLAVSLLRM